MLHDLILVLTRMSSGRRCRICGIDIAPLDHFGASEGVCPSCRR